MPTFPPVRTLIGFPYEVSSITLVSGDSYDATRYPLSNLTDGYGRTVWRSLYRTAALLLDLGTNLPVNFVGLVSHNLSPTLLVQIFADTVTITPPPPQPPDDEYDGSYVLNMSLARAIGVRYPNCWLDTRDAQGNPTTARYWQVHITDNTVPITLGEIVIGLADEYEGIIGGPYREQLYSWQSRKTLDYGKQLISGSGVISRTVDLSLTLTPDERAMLDAVYGNAVLGATDGTRVVVVPDSRRNDLWYVDWPARREATFPHSYREADQRVTLVEETFGAV